MRVADHAAFSVGATELPLPAAERGLQRGRFGGTARTSTLAASLSGRIVLAHTLLHNLLV
jgi:hypothetical protein